MLSADWFLAFFKQGQHGHGDKASIRVLDDQHLASQTSTVNTPEKSSDNQGILRTSIEAENVSSSVQSTTLPASNLSFEIDPNSIIRKPNFPDASGGLGDVYKCSLSRGASPEEVAVKCPRFPNLGKGAIHKVNHNIDREVNIWATLKHQYVLPLHGTIKGFGPFRALVSLWMPNGTLTSYLDRKDVTLATMDRLRILKQITEGLKYLHDNNVIHGDLTSNNVLVAADGSPRLADFGFSNIMVGSNPAFSYHTGAVRWVAPELIIVPEGQCVRSATKSSDIYSLGCIMLQILYGKTPYWWIESALQVVTLKFHDKEPINDTTGIQAPYLNFMRQCWSKNSESRPSVEEVLGFLEKAISNEAIST